MTAQINAEIWKARRYLENLNERGNFNWEEGLTLSQLNHEYLKLEEISEDSLYVLTCYENGFRTDLFLDFIGGEFENEETARLSPLLLVNGYPDVLEEQRHSYFSDKGYSYYMDRAKFRKIFDYFCLNRLV